MAGFLHYLRHTLDCATQLALDTYSILCTSQPSDGHEATLIRIL